MRGESVHCRGQATDHFKQFLHAFNKNLKFTKLSFMFLEERILYFFYFNFIWNFLVDPMLCQWYSHELLVKVYTYYLLISEKITQPYIRGFILYCTSELFFCLLLTTFFMLIYTSFKFWMVSFTIPMFIHIFCYLVQTVKGQRSDSEIQIYNSLCPFIKPKLDERRCSFIPYRGCLG